MLKKSIFTIFFLCLLVQCNFALGDMIGDCNRDPTAWWGNARQWRNVNGVKGDFHDGLNWEPTTVPECNSLAACLPAPPGPIISQDTTVTCLDVMAWGWAGTEADWGRTEVNVISCSVDAGSRVAVAGHANLLATYGHGTFAVYNGTVTTLVALPGDYNGLWIGGGESKAHPLTWGEMDIHGGLVSVPRIAVYNGYINVYDGTLECLHDVNTDRPDLYISDPLQGSPVATSRINLAGGILKLKGDWTAQVIDYAAANKIVAYDRRAASYINIDTSSGDTIITGVGDFGAAWTPIPTVGQVELPMSPATPLSWTAGDYVNVMPNQPGDSNGHRVYLGTSFNDVDTAVPGTVTATSVYRGAFDTNVYDINTSPTKNRYGPLAFNTTYYWRVDEVNVGNPNSPWRGLVWHFTTSSGKAYNPYPPNDSNIGFDVNKLYVRWTKGLLTQSTNGHQVYFGTSFDEVNDATTATPIVYRGTRTDANYPLPSLSPDYTLVSEANYYWRVDEVNTAHEPTVLKGYVWRMIFPNNYIIDNFNNYVTAEDMNLVWKQNKITGLCPGGGHQDPGGTLILDLSGGVSNTQAMILDYNNTGKVKDRFSEARHESAIVTTPLSPDANQDWTIPTAPSGQVKLFHISYKGLADNNADPTLDRMYVAIGDACSVALKRIGPVIYNPDPLAQRVTSWTDWYVKISDLSYDLNYPGTPVDINLHKIRYLFIGLGLRCNIYGSTGIPGGGPGRVTFDQIWLTQPICKAQFGPTADFSGDCFVETADLDLFATDWLLADNTLSYPDACAPPVAPVIWYDFNETTGNIANNTGSGGATYNGTVLNQDINNWNADGYIGRCIKLTYGQNSCVNVPPAALAPFAEGGSKTALTFSLWINLDSTIPATNWNGLIDANGGDNTEVMEIEMPTFQSPPGARARIGTNDLTAANRRPGDFEGRWNHYAIVKDADGDLMRIYENGAVIAEINNVDITTPLLNVVPTLFRIGSRTGDNWGMWVGKIDDFRMYDYALNADQVAWIATNGTTSLFVPLVEPTNMKTGSTPERVDFGDFALFADQWLYEQLWP